MNDLRVQTCSSKRIFGDKDKAAPLIETGKNENFCSGAAASTLEASIITMKESLNKPHKLR
jgi:hypothetical protein